MLVVIALSCQEFVVLGKIFLENLLLVVDLVMSFVGLTAIEEIQGVLEPQVKDVLLCQRHEVVLTSRHSANHIDKWDALARRVGMHLHFHVPLEVPSEDIMLQGLRLREDELDYVRLACRKYLGYLAIIQVERYPLEVSVGVPNSRYVLDIEKVQVKIFLQYEVL